MYCFIHCLLHKKKIPAKIDTYLNEIFSLKQDSFNSEVQANTDSSYGTRELKIKKG